VSHPSTPARILIIFFSLSGQSRGLVSLFAQGVRETGATVTSVQLKPLADVPYPFGSIGHTLRRMVITFLRRRVPIENLPSHSFARYDCIVLAGPTWSYNPSGPILYMLDRDGKRIFNRQTVLPLISCRGHWKIHNHFLRKRLHLLGANVLPTIWFTHPVKEPWSTIGVFLRYSGYRPEGMHLLKKRYPRYGHTRSQLLDAREEGIRVGNMVIQAKQADAPAISGCGEALHQRSSKSSEAQSITAR
jgi:hypothetical protein